MSQLITLSQPAYKDLVGRITRLERQLAKLLTQEKEPPYGSDEWWEWSDKKSMKEYKKGNFYELRTREELDDFFENIKSNRSNEQYHNKVRPKSRKGTPQITA